MVFSSFIGTGDLFSLKFTLNIPRPMLIFPVNVKTTFYVPYHEHNLLYLLKSIKT